MKKSLLLIIVLSLCCIIGFICYADYPLLTTVTYSADPSCLEYNGVLYSYWSNDDNNNGSYSMHQITCLSTTDLKHWTNHGQVFDVPRDCSWAYNSWAPVVVYRNGYFWMYFGNGAGGIGVAKSSSPTGPFKDAKGSALITSSMPNCNVQWCFDPGVLVDDDGRAYCFFGGGGPGNSRVIEIGSDMISTIGTAVTINAPYFFEDSWIHKYNGKYYYSYSSDFSRGAATIEYMVSSSPMTGYVAKGTVMPNPPDNSGNNNHHSIFQYRGNWYIGYHNRYVSIQQGIDTTYKRNAALDQLFYNTDGTMKLVSCTKSGLPLLGTPTNVTPTPVRVTPTPVRTATPRLVTQPPPTPTPVRVTPTAVQPTPTPVIGTGSIKIQFYNQSTAATSNQLYLNIKVVNTGSSAVSLANVKIRYYYTKNGTQTQNFYCDWTPVGGSNITGSFVNMSTPKTGADTYVEIGFLSGAGNLAAGGNTTVQARVAKSDWSNYTQTDDYSFNSSATTFVDWTKVTGYVSGSLQWGTEP